MSVLMVRWHHKPSRTWGIVMGVLTALVVLMSIAGALLPQPEILQ